MQQGLAETLSDRQDQFNSVTKYDNIKHSIILAENVVGYETQDKRSNFKIRFIFFNIFSKGILRICFQLKGPLI